MKGLLFFGGIPLVVLLASCALSQDADLRDNAISAFGDKDSTLRLLLQLLSTVDRLGQRFDNLAQEVDNLRQKLSNFDQSLNNLDQRIDNVGTRLDHKLDRLTEKLDNLECSADRSDVNDNVTSPGVDVDSPATTKQPEIPFRIARVLKAETDRSYKVTVFYEGTRKPDVDSFYGSFQITKHDLGVVQFDVPKGPRMEYPFLMFVLPDMRAIMELDLNNTADSMVFPHLDFVIAQGRDIKYNPGQPIELNITFTIDGVMDNIAADEVDFHILTRSDKQDNVVDRFYSNHGQDTPVKLVPVDYGGSMGYRFAELILNSTRENPEGIIGVDYGARFNRSASLPVPWLRYGFVVKFYLEGHDGPFPSGFIGFVNDTSYNNSLTVCDIDSNDCAFSCEAIGDDVIDIQMTKMTGVGPDSKLNTTTIISGGLASTAVHVPNVTFEDAGYYQCTAKSPAQQISRFFEMVVVKRAKINTELSKATVLDNGTLLVTCVAEGIPAPNVTFADMDDNMRHETYVTHPSQSETRTDVVIYEYDDFRDYDTLFFCKASNTQGGYSFADDYFEITYDPI